MWILLVGGTLLGIIGFIMHCMGASKERIALTLGVLFVIGAHLFIACCIYLVAEIFRVNGYPIAHLAEAIYLLAALWWHTRD